jgi:hypothetical protein
VTGEGNLLTALDLSQQGGKVGFRLNDGNALHGTSQNDHMIRI